MPPSFGVIYLFCSKIRSSHDCLSELMPQIVFKLAHVSRVGGVSNSHSALPGKHYKYPIPLFHLFLRQHPFYSILSFLSLLKNPSAPSPSRSQVEYSPRSQEYPLSPASRTRPSSAMASLSEIPRVRCFFLLTIHHFRHFRSCALYLTVPPFSLES